MKIKDLRKFLAEIPKELDEAEIYAYSHIDEGADHVDRLKVYDKSTYNANEGTPYCQAWAPWDVIKNNEGKWVDGPWKGTPAFVLLE